MKLFKGALVSVMSVVVGASLAFGVKAIEHKKHDHKHAAGCGHTEVKHDGHLDFAHDGHMHAVVKGHAVEHKFAVNVKMPAAESPVTHADAHKHAAGCGHEALPPGDHTDYFVDGTLHHVHGDHCDQHGSVN